ncbi:MAG: 5'-deoxynucleotidase [Oscillospiraceae bacterium]|nr:5'-deoxynucleotidase [Oscillospiraceae bacterium]
MVHGFCALFSRMNYIDRWGLMRNSRRESLAEHSAVTSCLAHVLSLIAVQQGADVRPETVATAALYHDLSETLTGDMPTPVKYRDADIRSSYKRVEKEAQKQVAQMLPASLRSTMMGYLDESALTEREHAILKAADKLSALIKCTEEARSGNTEFQSAERSTRAALAAMQLPELEIFLRDYLPAYCLTLDELMETAEPAAE